MADGPYDYSCAVEVNTLDSKMASSLPVDLIKLDAEGFGPMILESAQETLERSPGCAIMLELNLHRWQKYRPFEALYPLLGKATNAFAVTHESRLKRIGIDEMEQFLVGYFLSENYFLFCPDEHVENLSELLVDAS